jgi:hypothetical protein
MKRIFIILFALLFGLNSQAQFLINPYAYSGIPLSNGLVGFWKGNGNNDDSFGTNNGTSYNGATFDTGIIGQAFKYDGVNDYTQFATNQWKLVDSMTISIWIKFDNSTTTSQIPLSNFERTSGSNRGGFFLINNSANSLSLEIYNGNTRTNAQTAGLSVSSGVWAHLVWTYNWSTTTVQKFKNGVKGTSLTTLTGKMTFNANPLAALGSHLTTQLGSSNNFGGQIQYFRIYNRVLTDAEVTELYNSGTPY